MDVLPRHAADAVSNMSADLLLLEHYPSPQRVRLRTFAWSSPAYTFGVSQSWALYRARVPAETALVRRCTGGGLVSHLHDWTFALVIPPGHPLFDLDAPSSYAVVQAAIHAASAEQRQPVTLVPMPAQARAFRLPDDCARQAEPHDLVRVDDGLKVAGAAQKRNRHGLLIEGYVWRPFLPACDWARFERVLVERLGEALASPPVAVPAPIYEQVTYDETWAKFNSPEWNQRL